MFSRLTVATGWFQLAGRVVGTLPAAAPPAAGAGAGTLLGACAWVLRARVSTPSAVVADRPVRTIARIEHASLSIESRPPDPQTEGRPRDRPRGSIRIPPNH